MGEMTLPAEGGCRCGATRIRLTKQPILTSVCHCAGCQTMSASAFSTTITMPTDGFEVTKGDPVLGGLDRTMHHFCPECMTWMFTKAPGMDWFVNVRAGVLDDHAWFVPFVETFTSEKLPWATTPAKHSFETFPEMDDWAKLSEEYASG